MNKEKIETSLQELYNDKFGEEALIRRIGGGGSSREYFRMESLHHTAVGAYCDEIKELDLFIELDDMLLKEEIRVPAIYATEKNKHIYLLQDLGDVSLFSILGTEEGEKLSKKALDELIKIQLIPEEKWASKVGYKPFGERLVNWDLNYFKYDFLKPSGIEFDEEALEDDFDVLRRELLSPDKVTGLMYRDFQSRNIIVRDEELWFIDFQSARKGPLVYDAVSYIWQARAPFTYSQRETLGDYYCHLLSLKTDHDFQVIRAQFDTMSLFRTLQVLGAYGFRGLIQKKPHFLESIKYGIRNLGYILEKNEPIKFPELLKIYRELEKKYKCKKDTGEGVLTIQMYSFSYKNGYPDDRSGNGGGFIFDCRAIHNPGRYEEYKNKTGRDPEVIDFLDKTPEAGTFIENARNLIFPSIERYLRRGFTSLLIGFGCTGGQHRSVYCAEQLAKIIKDNFPEVIVNVEHREQGINYTK